MLARIINRPRRAYAAVAVTTVAGLVVLPLLGQSLLPNFKERDFLMHWLAKPDTSLQEEVRTTKLVNAELRRSRCPQRGLAHRQRAAGDEPYGVYFGRTGSASTGRSTTTRRSTASAAWSTATPGSSATS